MIDEVETPPEAVLVSQQCEHCGQVKPATKRYFPCRVGASTSFQRTCRKCKVVVAREKKLAEIEAGAVDNFIEISGRGGSKIPHTAELLENILHYFGGTSGFASIVLKQYFESPPGGRVRNSIIEMVVRLAAKNTEQGGAKKPIQLYSEEELEGEINNRLQQAVLLYGGKRYIDVTEEKPGEEDIDTAAFDGPLGGNLVLSDGRTKDIAGRIEREAHRSLAALQADPQADGIPPVHGE